MDLKYNSRLIDRDKEFEYIKKKVVDAATGNGGCVFITAEEGMGKTKLLTETTLFAEQQGLLYVNIYCTKNKSKIPYLMIMELMTDILRCFKGENFRLDSILEKFTKADVKNYKSSEFSKNIETVFLDFIFYFASVSPGTLIAIDNVHYCDKKSLELIKALAICLSNKKLIVILAGNENIKNNKLSFLNILNDNIDCCNCTKKEDKFKHTYMVEKIELDELCHLSITELVSRILGCSGKNIDDIAWYAAGFCRGNPFTALEFLKYMINKNILKFDNGEWVIDHKRIKSETTDVDFYKENIKNLNDEERNVLICGTIVDREFETNEISEILKIRDTTARNSLELLCNLGYVQKIPRIDNKEKYIISDLIKYKVLDIYNEISDKNYFEKLRLDCIKTLRTKNTEIIDVLFCFIFENDENAEYTMENLDKELSFSILYSFIAEICFYNRNFKEFENAFVAAFLLLSENIPVSRFYASIKTHISFYFKKVMHQFYICKQNNENKRRLLVCLYRLFSNYFAGYDFAKYLWILMRVSNLAKFESKDPYYSIISGKSLGMYYLNRAQLNKAQDVIKKTAQKGKILGFEREYALTICISGDIYSWQGKLSKAVECYEESFKYFRNNGDFENAKKTFQSLCRANFILGNIEKTKKLIDENLAIFKNNQSYDSNIIEEYYYFNCLADYYFYIGDFEKAKKAVSKNILRNRRSREEKVLKIYKICLKAGEIYLREGHNKKALKFFNRSLVVSSENLLYRQELMELYPLLAEAYIQDCIENKDKMTKKQKNQRFSKIEELLRISLDKKRMTGLYYLRALRVRSKYLELLNVFNEARKSYTEALKFAETIEAKSEKALLLYDYGCFLINVRMENEGFQAVSNAYEIFKEIGNKFFEKKIYNLIKNRDDNMVEAFERGDIDKSESVKNINDETKNISDYLENKKENNVYLSEDGILNEICSIVELSRNISSILEMNGLVKKVLEITKEVSGLENAILLLWNDKRNCMDIAAYDLIGENKSQIDIVNKFISSEVIDIVLKTKENFYIQDVGKESPTLQCDVLKSGIIKSILCVPLKSDNEIIGICCLFNTLKDSALEDLFSQDRFNLLNIIVGKAAISIENARQYRIAVTDELTELFNYSHFKYLLKKKVNAAKLESICFSLVIIDIENFKKINELYGYESGNLILIKVSEIMRKFFESAEIITRCGGGRFALILSNLDSKAAKFKTEFFRKVIEETEFQTLSNSLKISICAGISTFPNHAGESLVLIDYAEQALMYSKSQKSNINKVTIWCDEFK